MRTTKIRLILLIAFIGFGLASCTDPFGDVAPTPEIIELPDLNTEDGDDGRQTPPPPPSGGG